MEYIANKEIIVRRIAQIFKTGEVANLGIGLPTLVEKYISPEVNIILMSENGIMGLGPAPAKGCESRDITDSGGSVFLKCMEAGFILRNISHPILQNIFWSIQMQILS